VIQLALYGTESEIQDGINALCPFAAIAVHRVSMRIKYTKTQEIMRYQARALYLLATQYNRNDAVILEIGTFHGFSAALIASAAGAAKVITLDCEEDHVLISREKLWPYPNVEVVHTFSQDFPFRPVDMVFVDGDHIHGPTVRHDLEWWDHLRPGGLLLIHDVCMTSTWKATEVVDAVIDFMAAHQISQPDVAVVDGGTRGMIGFYKREH